MLLVLGVDHAFLINYLLISELRILPFDVSLDPLSISATSQAEEAVSISVSFPSVLIIEALCEHIGFSLSQ